MGLRRRARELAMQALYYIDIRGGGLDDKVTLFGKIHPPPEKSKQFFTELVDGVLRYQTALDDIIEEFSNNWKISRMSCVDRNVLRIALFEILARDDIPIKVTINEAIDVGKKYGTDSSGAFINGILDSIHQAWKQGRITFEPLTDSDQKRQSRQDVTQPDQIAVATKGGQEMAIDVADCKQQIIRLSPELRKRVMTPKRKP